MISIDAIDCPKCKEVGTFGVFWIDDRSAFRRCRSCKHRRRERLPELKKTIICLDQNALSQMMMLLNPAFPRERRDRVNPLWGQIFNELYSAVRDQIVCCPMDEIHSRESAVFAYGEATLSVLKMLNGETEFRPLDELIGEELFYSAKHWHTGEPQAGPEFGRIRAFSESPDRWLNWFRIEVTGMWEPASPEKIRAARERHHTKLQSVYERWRKETLSFTTHFKEELHSFGKAVLQGFFVSMQQAQSNAEIMLFGTSGMHYMRLVRAALEQAGVSPDESLDRAIIYYLSDAPTNIPSAIVRALLYAKQANLLRNGMKVPLPSAKYDIDRLSSLLPHCDAILMEGHFAAMLRELDAAGLLPEGSRRCRVFSVRELGSFIDFLGSVRATVSAEQIAIARRLYGEGVPDAVE